MKAMRVRANGIDLNVLVWEGRPGATLPPVVMLHGFMDAARSFELCVPWLTAAGYQVIAPDLRGFGDSGRVPESGYYHFADYVADVAHLLEQITTVPVLLVGHSMGGTVATLFAGACSERVAKLAILEGLGPPGFPPDVAVMRMRKWLDDLAAIRSRAPDKPMTEDEALRRLGQNHARVDKTLLRERMRALVRETEDGLVWAFDPLHRTTSPMPYTTPMYRAFASKVSCPVLYVTGGTLGYRPPDEDDRLEAFASLERFDLPEAGHMMHWTEPQALAQRLVSFFA